MTSPTPSRRRYVKALHDIAALVEAESGGKPADRQSLAYRVHALAVGAVTRRHGPSKKINLAGKRFGRLVVQRDTGERRPNTRTAIWLAICDCGNETRVDGAVLRRQRGTRSCGCLRGENLRIGLRRIQRRTFPGGYDTPPMTETRVHEVGWL